jgi:hypothetical protein
MLTRADVDEVKMDAEVKAAAFIQELMQAFTEPHMQAMEGKAWQEMDPLKKAVIEKMAPAAAKQGERRYGRRA